MSFYTVFDVGGSSIKYALMNESGDFIDKSSVSTPKEGIESFVNLIDEIVKNYQKSYFINGMALSMPGAVDIETGFIYGVTAVPYIHGPNIKQILQERTNLAVELENDANCAGLAEGWIGAAQDVNDYICVVIGTGIGGAVVLDKKIRHGKNLFGGEFGYMIMEDYFDRSIDEPIGETWSSLAATGGLIVQVAKRIGMDEKDLNGKIIFDMAEAGDLEVEDEIEKFYTRLSVGIYNLQYIIDPEKILIGGAISHREGFIERLNQHLSRMKQNQESLEIQVERCQFGNDSNLIGALYHFLQRGKINPVESSC